MRQGDTSRSHTGRQGQRAQAPLLVLPWVTSVSEIQTGRKTRGNPREKVTFLSFINAQGWAVRGWCEALPSSLLLCRCSGAAQASQPQTGLNCQVPTTVHWGNRGKKEGQRVQANSLLRKLPQITPTLVFTHD